MAEAVVDEDRAHKREALLERLSPGEKALFMLMEHLVNLKGQPRSSDDPKLTITWGPNERPVQEVYKEMVQWGLTSPLSVPPGCQYTTFKWMEGYELDPEVRRRYPSWQEYKEAFPSKGSGDIRIYVSGGLIRIFANQGSFAGMEADWEKAVGDIPYPIEVADRHKFEYKNKAFQTLQDRCTSKGGRG